MAMFISFIRVAKGNKKVLQIWKFLLIAVL